MTARERLRVVMPWRVAESLYGPYTLVQHFELANHDEVQLTEDVRVQDVRPALEWALSARTLITLGVLITVVKWISAPVSPFRAMEDWLLHAGISAVFGPVGLLIGAGVLVWLAQPAHRDATRLAVRRPIRVALLTALVMVVTLGGVFSRVNLTLGHASPLMLPVGIVINLWVIVFFICTLYLVHHNGLSHRGHPLLRPITTTFLAWATAILPFVLPQKGLEPTPGVITVALLGSTVATAISVWEWRAAQRV
ncbi:hypothetical protein NLX83_32985 [Allokutzneria sp. A3M-2-11 16]|uniref:hypothetical protein n=1 Tax=Allokutzneria sp. A3M-2-11 16 TaxID=2962043 RepID=UPI0020B8EFD9|nr:hypothetical protein [Allokutzneria sp. A3M-2-11 16]MCP3804098.1 hypothetical protein [Allokutzneria sp. A3M-2-11 16]